jgi:hypothetical protein
MGLRTLASGVLTPGSRIVYTAPTGRWTTITSIQVVNKAGADCQLDIIVRSAGPESHIIPSGFTFKNRYKIEHDVPVALNPAGYVKIYASLPGLSYVITGEERTSE